MFHTILLSSISALLWISQSAEAAPGDHIGTEQTQLVPRVDFSTQYRTNVYLEEGEVGGGEPVKSSALVLLSTNLGLNTENENLSLRLNGIYGIRKYLNDDYANLNRFKDGRVNLNSVILPKNKVSLVIDNTLVSSARETNQVEAESAYLQQFRNESSAGLRLQPSSAIDLRLLGSFEVTDIKGAVYVGETPETLNNRYRYGVNPSLTWSFLPKTDFFVRLNYSWLDWQFNAISADPAVTPECGNVENCFIGIPNSTVRRTTYGLVGRFTDKTALTLTTGPVSANYDETSVDGGTRTSSFANDLEFWSYGARFELFPSEFQTFFVSYRTDFRDVYFTNFSRFNLATLGYNGNISRKLVMKTQISRRLDDYDGVVDRTDVRITTRNDFDIAITKFAFLTTGVWWERLVSQDGFAELEYDDVNVHAGVAFIY
ncbi:MAG: hypothetical protein VXZ96_10865 [Myxococcota bacterium]|nr:hypothetical protein [Myxococcota bacterium]